MLFDFHAFIDEMREKPDKKEIVEKYENLHGTIQGDLRDQIWFTQYLSKFEHLSFLTPEELGNDFDWEMLQKLVLGSFSSDYEFKNTEESGKRELYIAVKSGDQSVVKTISELWSFQVLRLYEIYIEEQMNLEILKADEGQEAIEAEREMRLKKWQAVLSTLDRAEEVEANKADQEEKLGDLLGKL